METDGQYSPQMGGPLGPVVFDGREVALTMGDAPGIDRVWSHDVKTEAGVVASEHMTTDSGLAAIYCF